MCALISAVNLIGVKIAARTGARLPMAVGQLLMGTGALLLLLTGSHTSLWVPVLLLVPVGLGGGLAVPSLTAALLENIDGARAGTAAALLNTFRQVGSCLAVAAFGALITDRTAFLGGLHLNLVISGVMLLVTAAAT
ncbi:MFS transporter [Streptomyces sp. NBC_00859]|uniref:MFS transporter n=1 Tax=Streptomyces sp. NBC_00859 TaxID=2903682 RepID=UPI00386C0073|nr:MFS transporter [Streptomyces sp. NBC_00859]